MKKIINVLCVCLVVVSMCTACGSKKENTDEVAINPTKEAQSQIEETEQEVQTEVNVDEDWGVEGSILIDANGFLKYVYINFPTYGGRMDGYGVIGYQTDEVFALFDGQYEEVSPVIENIREVLPAYFEQTEFTMDCFRSYEYSDFSFDIKNSEELTINGYDMCKYVGTHSYIKNDEPCTINFVAYSTQAKVSGAYMYWMVLDESEDQSLFDTIDEYALKMAYTIKEEE